MKKFLTLWLFSLSSVLALVLGLAALWTAYVCRCLYELAEGFAGYADDRLKAVRFRWE
jgi:hypothetical protein